MFVQFDDFVRAIIAIDHIFHKRKGEQRMTETQKKVADRILALITADDCKEVHAIADEITEELIQKVTAWMTDSPELTVYGDPLEESNLNTFFRSWLGPDAVGDEDFQDESDERDGWESDDEYWDDDDFVEVPVLKDQNCLAIAYLGFHSINEAILHRLIERHGIDGNILVDCSRTNAVRKLYQAIDESDVANNITEKVYLNFANGKLESLLRQNPHYHELFRDIVYCPGLIDCLIQLFNGLGAGTIGKNHAVNVMTCKQSVKDCFIDSVKAQISD